MKKENMAKISNKKQVSRNFGEWIKRIRENVLVLSVSEMALRLGVHRQTIVRYESNKMKPASDIIQKIAIILGINILNKKEIGLFNLFCNIMQIDSEIEGFNPQEFFILGVKTMIKTKKEVIIYNLINEIEEDITIQEIKSISKHI